MKRKLIFAACLLAVLAATWWFVIRNQPGPGEADAKTMATAQVQLAPLHRGTIEKTLVAYGTATAPPGGTRIISFPLEYRVDALLVSPGQAVAAGDSLVRIQLSADSQLAFETALSAKRSAALLLADVQRRMDAHLATNQDLVAAQSAEKDAESKLDSMETGAVANDGIVHSPVAGIVTKTPAQPGMIVAAGGELVEIAVENRLEAQLGVTPPDAGEIKEGQEVRVYPVEPGHGTPAAPISGRVRFVGRSVDSSTQLVNAFVTLNLPAAGDPSVLMGSYLRAEIVVDTKETLLAPRDAIVPDEDGKTGALFSVSADGKAEKGSVSLGIDDGTNVEVSGTLVWLKPGTQVVTVGSHELDEGTPVDTSGKAEP